MILRFALSIFLALAFVSASAAQSTHTENTLRLDEEAVRPAASIDDLAWLAGLWRGEGLGGTVEETWSPPLGGTMEGAFKLVKDDAVAFYEMMAFVQSDGSLELWVKHFNADFTGWEEKEDKVVFPLVALEPGLAQFHGLTFQREGTDAMSVFLAMGSGDGNVREAHLRYRRVK